MTAARGNILIRLVKGEPNETKRIKYKMEQGELVLTLAKTKISLTPDVLKEWHEKGWYIESDDVKRATGMLRTISTGYLLIDVKEVNSWRAYRATFVHNRDRI